MKKPRLVSLVYACALVSAVGLAEAQTRKFVPNLPPGPMQPSGPIDLPRPIMPAHPLQGPNCASSCGTQCAGVSCSGLSSTQCRSARQDCRVVCRTRC